MRLRTLTFLLALALAGGAATAESLPPDCGGDLPLVLNVGIPYTKERTLDSNDVTLKNARAFLDGVLERVYPAAARCRNRALQVNAALGSDYQMLEWLGSGAVDMAVVSSLTLHLLQRDGVEVLEVPVGEEVLPRAPADRGGAQLVRAEVGGLVSTHVAGGRSPRVGQEGRDLETFRDALLERARWDASRESTELSGRPRLHTRIVFPSHLSTVGFVVPVAATRDWLEVKLAEQELDDEKRGAVRTAFWNAFFDHACFHFGSRRVDGPSCTALGGTIKDLPGLQGRERELPARPATIEIEVVALPAPAAAAATGKPSFQLGDVQRDHLVIRRDRAEELFVTEHPPSEPPLFAPVGAVLTSALTQLFGKPRQPHLVEAEPEQAVAPPFDTYLRPQRYFGTRTFAFTAEESLRLLASHQQALGSPGVALVLPGGGVKAAYQSRLIDELYAKEYLVNQDAGGARGGKLRLGVLDVIGTSGGALLGYFVAQLGPAGPFDLSRILWFVEPATGDREVELDSAAVFGWTDLPRYASLLAILLVFSLGLAACSLGPRGWLSPDPAAPTAGVATTMRTSLLVPVVGLLVATPLLVRWVSGDLSLEHVPELEGLLFAVLLVSAMYVDQCMVASAEPPTPSAPTRRAAKRALGGGLALMGVPALVALCAHFQHLLEAKVAAGFAYLLLGLVAVVLLIRLMRRWPGRRLGAAGITVALLVFAAGTVGAYLFLHECLSLRYLQAFDRAPLFFLGLGLTLVGRVLVRAARGRTKPRWYSRIEERGSRVASGSLGRSAAAVAGTMLACLFLLDLTRPPAREFMDGSALDLLRLSVASKLDVPIGGLAVCAGALVVLYGIVLWSRGSGRYAMVGSGSFSDAVLFVLVGISIAVYLSLLVVSLVAPGSLTFFELTAGFWKGLLIASAATTVVLLLWVYLRPRGGPATQLLRRALVYLCSRHPNAHLITRRFVRMLLIAATGLVWWNFLLAPGLYGNRYASGYFKGAVDRFQVERRKLVSEDEGRAPRLTTNLVAVANALETDGSRFFLVVPHGAACPAVRLPPGSGSTWYRFHALSEPRPPGESASPECPDLDLTRAEGRNTLDAFVFASGSPFPIFPAHWVVPVEGGRREALVDGGYTNNTPVEAAHQVGAERVLIVNSSNPAPLPEECRGDELLARVSGPLVALGLRLPGFLFDRAQQLDRRSRAEVFVVSLSPPPRCDWPFLADFRGDVVRRMLDSAWRDLGRRIGMVESWGPPRFQLSVGVAADPAPAEVTPGPAEAADSGRPATPPAPPAPARARSR